MSADLSKLSTNQLVLVDPLTLALSYQDSSLKLAVVRKTSSGLKIKFLSDTVEYWVLEHTKIIIDPTEVEIAYYGC